MARRTKGEGTLRKRKDGRWEGWFNIGKTKTARQNEKALPQKPNPSVKKYLTKPKKYI